ncbi:hypothetical protein AOCH_002968 [Aspergillus ochraceoroseus]|uniref:Carrier domain-containing protein n=1 Tax=Aspergillus ochraceoroseus TaxID=138278 RepID=A0A0F8XP84_9EURO|nr:hypothetical protein AOCH_002968 [Aspergillus ochraceoroseus]
MVRTCCDRTKGSGGTSVRSMLAINLPSEIHVKVLQQEICIFLEWWNTEISVAQMDSVACYFENLLNHTLSTTDVVLTDLNSFLGLDWSRICKFNSVLPEAVNRCIHDVIRERSLIHPQNEAVCAWDGSFTYGELDYLSSKLASHLQAQGVGPEVRVPLCFDKSKWYIVAMLGVLKAGGAFVPLDPTHPTSRLRSLVQSINARIMLCSRNREEHLGNVAELLTPLDDILLNGIQLSPGEVIQSQVNSSNAAYLIFTSGSTGQPKGTLLEHGAYVSSAMAHGPPVDIDSQCRMLQFAAHTFDASLFESLTPLIHGGCVCIPSDKQRLNDIVGAINQMKVNVACLTPSFVKFVDPSQVPSLKTLVLAGEAMSKTHQETWSNIKLVNGYGPTESAVSAALNTNIRFASDCQDIGFPTGVRAWIANPNNHDQLVPVGSPGELLLEGPTLARCYVNNEEKTNEVFIYNPAWSRDNPGSGDRRFYKTGDLVRYNSDAGSLTFIGRKDTQIKLHGQRIELGEIENNLSTLPKVKHSLAFLSGSGFSKGKIVAVLSLQGGPSSKEMPLKLLDHSKKSVVIAEFRSQLSSRLPTYMIPSVWLCVESLPLLPSGKLNRKEVMNWVINMAEDPDNEAVEVRSVAVVHTTDPENTIHDRLMSVWSRVLNIPRNQIGLDQGFLSLGGDSIAAITCMGFCKKQGMGVTVQDILQSKSIKDLATHVKEINQPVVYQEATDQPFGLSPIQKLHFMARREGQGHFNQGIRTRLNQPVAEGDLRRSIETLIRRHSMLRVRLSEDDSHGFFQQRITQDVDGSYQLQTHNIRHESDIEQAISESQLSINAVNGPLLSVDIFQRSDDATVLSMVAHHLVVDIVSWRIILEDLEDLLLNADDNTTLSSSLPFPTWCRLQDERTHVSLSQKSTDLDSMLTPDFAYWGMENPISTYGDVVCEIFEVSAEDTQSILLECHDSLQTEPIDILLAALMHSFGQTFKDRPLPTIFNEGHGREVWDSTIDISRTVGWFTTVFPISVTDFDASNPVETVIRVKDVRRSVLDNGRQAFADRMFSTTESGDCRHPCPMEITFNYVGQHRDLQRQDGLFKLMDQMAGETGQGGGAADFGEETPRFGLFEISALAVNGKLRFTFSFNKYMKHQEAIHDWISCCSDLLKSIGKTLQDLSPRPTLGSFPMLPLTYQELENMVAQKLPSIGVSWADIEDAYPCSRMQQSILLARSRDSSLYAVHDTYEVFDSEHKPDATKLGNAWRMVVSRHAMLRTLFVENLTSRDLFCQIVLKSFEPSPIHLRCSDDCDVLETFDIQKREIYNEHQPHHRLTICETTSGKVFFRIELSHAAMDGVSISIILRDLQMAYEGKLNDHKPIFRNYMQYLHDLPQAPSFEYWRTYLADIKPCIFPILDDGKQILQKQLRTVQLSFGSFRELQSICEQSGLTLSTAFSAAWGLTLRLFCGSNDVCFSYMTSLRDASVRDIESVVGPVINLLACRMQVSEDDSLKGILQRVQDNYMHSLPHKTLSLIDIQHELKLSDTVLLNTGVSYRKVSNTDTASTTAVEFSRVGTIQDPAEFPLFVNIEVSEQDASIELNYWTNHLSDKQAENVATIFLKCLKDIVTHHDEQIAQVENLSEWNKRQIRRWNKPLVEEIDMCVHEAFHEKVAAHPDAIAIAAWDGTLTYASLDDLSSRLASYLAQLGISTGDLVPIHFNKSIWQIVSIIAVLKAGGVCVPRNEAHFPGHLDGRLTGTAAHIVLASVSHAEVLEGEILGVIAVDESLFDCLSGSSAASHTQRPPSDDGYVVLTCGDSQPPKATILDHRAILSRANTFSSALKIGSETRTLQFAPYTTDMFLQEVFGTLMSGGCLCIPEGDEPSQLVASINKLDVNLLSVTPSMASLIQQSDVPSIRILSLFGEAIPNKVIEIWSNKVELHGFYGTAECSFTCIHNPNLDKMGNSHVIGSSVGCRSWLVDPSNHSRLVPVGCVGELVIEGPGVSHSYLCEGELAKSSFIKESSWGSHRSQDSYSLLSRSSGRMMKTGDLARYNSDGTFVYLGKKGDISRQLSQITTFEIERFLERFSLPGHRCVVDTIGIDDEKSPSKSLVVFALPETNESTNFKTERTLIGQKTLDFHNTMAKLHSYLSNLMPSSQVPDLYFPIQVLPLTTLGKLNRRMLREAASALPEETRCGFSIKAFGDFWRAQLEKPVTSHEFLSVPQAFEGQKKMYKSTQVSWNNAWLESQARTALICAWALTIHSYAHCDDIIFGDLLLDAAGGSTKDILASATVIPRRIRVDNTCTIAGFLKQVDSALAAAKPYQKAPFRCIKNLGADAAQACKFNSLLSVSVSDFDISQQSDFLEQLESDLQEQCGLHLCPLALFCSVETDGLQLRVRYDNTVLYSSQAERLTSLFVEYLEILASKTVLQEKLCDLAKTSDSLRDFKDNVAYWKEGLAETEPCLFPSLSTRKGEQGKLHMESLKLKNVIWGLVLRCYTGLEDACFGYYGPRTSLADNTGQPKVKNAQHDLLPCKLSLHDEMNLQDLIAKRRIELDLMFNHRMPLHEIEQVAGFESSPLFNTIFRYTEEFNNEAFYSFEEALSRYLIIVNAKVSGSSGEIDFKYLPASLSSNDIGSIMDCFEHTLGSVLTLLKSDALLRDVDFFGPRSCQQVCKWNATLPERPSKCAHEVIQEQVAKQPSAPAICSWDGDFSYKQLDLLSTKLAIQLINSGVGPEVFIGLCFEKSAWAVIAQVAVLKAGGAFASLDPSHPESRLKGLVDDINAPIVLCSRKYLDKVSRVCKIALAVTESVIEQIPDSFIPASIPKPSIDNAAYAIFTSGTTGKPKATVLEHIALGIASVSFAHHLSINSTTRALQFSSYTFDVSVLETIIVLMTGGCVCVPSDEERLNNLAGAINRMKANFVTFTPSVMSTLNPESVPTLSIIICGGEKLTESHVSRWVDRHVFNAYGPSEATIIATASLKTDSTGVRIDDDINCIGTALCGRAWIVDPKNYNRLLPVGAVGELVLEGCNTARGYLNNDKKNQEVFIKNPRWCPKSGLRDVLDHSERMYRTGDLVRYKSDGNLCFISRMDTQIKLNGQRIELEEIEKQCALSLPGNSQVVVDIVTPETKMMAKGLAAFFTVNDAKESKDVTTSNALVPGSESTQSTIERLYRSLSEVLPQLMIPKFYFPMRYLPLGATGKLDRKGLQAMVQALSKTQLKAYMISNTGPEQAVAQGVESTLRNLWAEVLDLEPSSISAEDSFFGLGGDSFSAMKLVGAAMSQGISLSVADIYGHPGLSDLGKRCNIARESTERPVLKRFSLLSTDVPFENILEEVSEQCSVPGDSISDIYPCSAVQEGLFTLSIQHRGSYIARPIFQLAPNIDLERFKASWQQAVDENDILRTRIVHTEAAGFLQAVLNHERISWSMETTFDNLMEDTLQSNGGLLTNYAIVQPGPSVRYFVWVIHHALYDGWSIPQILKRVEEIYLGTVAENSTIPYNLFINYLLEQDPSQSDEFWKLQLSNLSSVPFPESKNSDSGSIRVGNRQSRSMNIARATGSVDITIPELIRAAWSIVVSIHTGCGDVCFGETLMGRNVDMPGITDVAGPALTTVPMRLKVDNGLQIPQFLYYVRQLTAAMIPHQHSGLQRIQKLSSDTALACEFQNLLVIQSDYGQLNNDIWAPENNQTNGEFFTYPLVVECKVSEYELTIQAHHDELILGSWQVERLLGQFSFVLEQLLNTPKGSSMKVGEIDVSSPLDKADIASWNQRNPTCVDRCAHDIIREQSLTQPNAPAICSWDGQLTYEEMFSLASSFAAYLVSCGIGPETLIPVCLDKSVWAVVTILAILIAGGAFVPLDPSHPTSRHKEVLAETQANMIICSPQYRGRYLGSVSTVIPVSKDTIKAYKEIKTITKPRVSATPSNMAYAIFTSGSTGRAKGIIIDHRAISSSVMAFGPIVHLNKDARALQFASLTFDAAIMEVLGTLMLGGCICIPNEEERLNDIAGAMQRMNVTWAFLTPSIAAILDPSSLPSLKVLSCGGEKLTREVVTKWAHRVKLINGYGPTETTIFAVLNTDFINHELTPLGAVGELALEGAALAREYLRNPTKTAEAFITDPVWMKNFQSPLPSPRRVYKTGDLVKYNPDGSIECLGRKDHQIKLHGQRMELGEIEHRLYEDQRIRHAVVVLPQKGPLRHKLVAVLSLNSLISGSSIIASGACELVSQMDMIKLGRPETSAIQNSLERQLPIYMVPQVWAVMKNIPMLVSGKLDRKRITHWVEELAEDSYAHIMQDYDNLKGEDIEQEKKDEKGAVLEILRDVFAQVLNLPKHMIDPNRSFINQGGDSITGMAVIAKARKQGLSLALNRVLQSKSMHELVAYCDGKPREMKRETESIAPFNPSPVQELFFRCVQAAPKGCRRFNQSMTVGLSRKVKPRVIEDAVRAVVNKHSMFRARFSKARDGTWQQRITEDIDSSYKFRIHSVKNNREILRHAADSQGILDIQAGPIFATDLFEFIDGHQVLFLVASHLCVDMVSWRLVLQDIQEFVDTGSLAPETPLSFQSWCNLQAEDCNKEIDGLDISMEPPNLDYWGMKNSPNNYGDVKMETFTLSEQATRFLVRDCHDVLRTETIEVLLSAVIQAFGHVFNDRDIPTIYNEGHGREAWDSSIDPSRTAGWFTTLCPLHIKALPDLLDTLKRVKDSRRQIAGINRALFARNILHSDKNTEADKFPVPLEILFNYLGQLQQLEGNESLFQHYGDVFNAETFELAGDMGPETPRFALFEVSALIVKEKLHVSFTYNRNMRREAQIQKWASECKRILEIDLLQFKNLEPEPSLSDYPLLPITYQGLKNLTESTLPCAGISRLNQVEDIYPCSPVQEGILLSQLKDPQEYIFNAVFEVQGHDIDLARLQKAWSAVVSRHSILRTLFVDSNCKGSSFDQVVVKDINEKIIDVEFDDSSALAKIDTIRLKDANAGKDSDFCHQLVICKTSTRRVLLKIEMNHAIIDGGSIDILLRDLKLAYSNRLPPGRGPLFSEYIRHIKGVSQHEALAYWKQHLAGVRPCHLPVSTGESGTRQLGSLMMTFDRFPELQRFCEDHSMTLANLTLAAWSIVLRQHAGSDDVCFGYPSTGRDSPVPGIQDAVGIFINMLCCRVQFSAGQTFLDVIKAVQNDYIQGLPYQTCSLAQIQHALGQKGKTLFNTTISIQNHSDPSIEKTNISFKFLKAFDPTEYPITVNVETARGREGILLRYWTNCVSEGEATTLADSIAKVFTCFIEDPSKPISELDPPIPMRTVDNGSLEEIIDNRIKVVINQLLKEGKLAIPSVKASDSNSSHASLPLEGGIQASICNVVVARGMTPSDSAQTLTDDYKIPADMERRLWRLWSITLGLPPNPVKHHDSFFKLGGDSITAMKLVGLAREEGVMLTVADVFKNPGFEDLLLVFNEKAKLTTSVSDAQKVNHIAKSEETKPTLPESGSSREISILQPVELDNMSLRAAICPKVGVFKGGIVDVLPVTDFQSLSITATMFESRWMLNYFYLDGRGSLDIKRLRESFLRVVDAFDILRTVFVCFHGQFFQVVLRKIRPDIFIYETEKSLDEYTASLQQRDRDQSPRQGEQYTQFYVVKKRNSDEHRILIRMSHAQFDGVCLPRIMTAIKMAYEGSPVPGASSFMNYMRLLPGTITPEHYQHWTSLLKGSQMTEIIQRDTPNSFQHIGGFAQQRRVIDVPSTAIGDVTIATIMQSAWATTLAKLSAQDDVVFGLTVNGRNATIPGVENTIGPCLNIIPVRVKFRDQWTALDLFRYLQDQHVANMPYESLGFREIIRRCTDWPDSTHFTTSVFHQNVEYEGHMQLDRNNYTMSGVGVTDNFTDLTLVSKPVAGQPNKLTVSLGYSLKGPIHTDFAINVLDMVCETLQSLVSNPNVALPSPSTLRSIPSQVIGDASSTLCSNNDNNNNNPLPASLNNRSLSEILTHSSLITQIWQQVLPPKPSTGKPHASFQLDSSFFQLGGDIVNMGQVVWLLEQETTLHIPLEHLLQQPTFLGQMAVLAMHTATHEMNLNLPASASASAPAPAPALALAPAVPGPTTPTEREMSSLPPVQGGGGGEQWSALAKARTLAKRITRFGGSTRLNHHHNHYYYYYYFPFPFGY